MTAPAIAAGLLLVVSIGCSVGGVLLLAGTGWALITAASASLLVAVVILRGMRSAG